MEKYAKLMKGLEICAGPDCSTECPYHGVHAAGRTCRSWLLSDAAAAIANEEAGSETLQELLHDTEAELQDTKEALETATAECETLEERARSVEAHRDAIESDRADITRERNDLRIKLANITEQRNKFAADNVELHKECEMSIMRYQALQGEINALMSKIGKQEEKTDRPSAISDDLEKQIGELVAHANYQQGRADALAAIVERCSFGGGCRHE